MQLTCCAIQIYPSVINTSGTKCFLSTRDFLQLLGHELTVSERMHRQDDILESIKDILSFMCCILLFLLNTLKKRPSEQQDEH